MNLFKFNYQVEDCALTTTNEQSSKILRKELCSGNHVASYDDRIKLELIEGSQDYLNSLDFVYLYDDGLLCNESTFELLKDMLKECGEWTRMHFKNNPFYFFSTLKSLDCLDEENTIFDIYDGPIEELKGAKYGIIKHAFKALDYSKSPIFRMKNEPFPIVTQEFIDFVKDKNLKGLRFEMLGDGSNFVQLS